MDKLVSDNTQQQFPTPTYAPERWKNTKRNYSYQDVKQLQGSFQIKYSLAEKGAEKLWKLLHNENYINTLGAFTGNQAIQHVRGGLKAIYLSGWQVAADANLAGQMYPDQSLYPANSVPAVVRKINQAFIRADQIQHLDNTRSQQQQNNNPNIDWFAPIIADAEAGFGGPLNAFELMKSMIEAGAAGVHFEDQLASEKKCGHLGGKVLLPTSAMIRMLNSARLAADVSETPTLIIARTDAESARLITSDIDENDKPFITGQRTTEGFYNITGGFDMCVSRSLAYAPYADLLWMETSTPNLKQAKKFAESIKKQFPEQMLAYNCSPSFNWSKHLDKDDLAKFQSELGAMGFKFQFITLAGFHSLNYTTFKLAQDYSQRGMAAYAELQDAEFAAESQGFTAVKHQHEVGVGYFDAVANTISGGEASTTALKDSTEKSQF